MAPVLGLVAFLVVALVAILAIPQARAGLFGALSRRPTAEAIALPTSRPTVAPSLTPTSSPEPPETAPAHAAATSEALQTINAQTLATGTAQAKAASTARAQATEAAQAIASITAQAQSDATAEANATATAQAQATLGAQATSQAQTQPTATRTATPTQTQPTATRTATPTQAQPTFTPTTTPMPTASPVPTRPGPPGLVLDFEQETAWRRGDEPYGEIERTSAEAKAGSFSAKLGYAFPAVTGNYVVFHPQPAITLAGQPTGLVAWVHGEGCGHFLNAWIRDAAGEVRQYTFGRITHQGWKQLSAPFDEGRGWPNAHISGPDDGKLSYPVSLYALVLDGVPEGQASTGAIYLDELYASEEPVTPSTPQPTQPPTSPSGEEVQVVFEFDWGSGWIGVDNRGGWALASDGHKYVTEMGFLSRPESLEKLKAVVPAGWRAKLIMRANVGWVSCVSSICQEHSSSDPQKIITNQVYFRSDVWGSLVNDYLAGGWYAVTQNAHYDEIQRVVFEPIGQVPDGPCIGFKFTQTE